MAFFKHLGSNANKFQFEIWVDTVVGIYPSNYNVDHHTTAGIYVLFKRKHKSFRTKIALPQNGGAVNINDCLKFTSTIYQKKKRREDVSSILPKPFIIRVCNASRPKIRWESCIELSDYASVFGVDTKESFNCTFKPKWSKLRSSSNKDILNTMPKEIILRVRVKSVWLKKIDETTRSLSSGSRISSSVFSTLSDGSDNWKLFDDSSVAKIKNSVRTVPENHSLHNSIMNSPQHHNLNQFKSEIPKMSSSNSMKKVNEINDESNSQRVQNLPYPPPRLYKKRKESVLDSFKAPVHKKISNLSNARTSDDEILMNSLETCENQLFNQSSQINNLSLLASPPTTNGCNNFKRLIQDKTINDEDVERLNVGTTKSKCSMLLDEAIIEKEEDEEEETIDDDGKTKKKSKCSMFLDDEVSLIDDNILTSMQNNVIQGNSAVNEELILFDTAANIESSITYVLHICITQISHINMDDRIWNNIIPKHSAILFRCFLEWNVFNNNINTQIMLKEYIFYSSKEIELHSKNVMEQSYWLLRLCTMIYWIHIYYPQQMRIKQNNLALHLIKINSHDDNGDNDDDDDSFHTIESKECVQNEIYSAEVTDEIVNRSHNSLSISDEIEEENDEESTTTNNDESVSVSVSVSLQFWFANKLSTLLQICFDNILDVEISKLKQIPFQRIFDASEFGETGSITFDCVVAVIDSVWLLWDNLKLFNIYKIDICYQLLIFSVNELINILQNHPQFCTLSGGFRLKIIKGMIWDWILVNKINEENYIKLITLLDQTSALLLTCAVVQNGKDLLDLCPLLTPYQINQILNNYNSEQSNEPLNAEILTPILEAVKKSGESKGNIGEHMLNEFNVNNIPLPKIILSEIAIPFALTQQGEFEFLLKSDNVIL